MNLSVLSSPQAGYWLAALTYIGASLLALYLWYTVTRHIKKPFGSMLWIVMFAVLFTPVIVDGPSPALAPAIVGAIFAFLSKDTPMIVGNLAPIALSIGIGFLFGFLYEQIKTRI